MKKSHGKNYAKRAENGRPPLKDILTGLALGAGMIWLCFGKAILLPAAVLFVPFFLKYRRSQREQKRLQDQRREFKSMMTMMYSSVSAGNTLERSLLDSLEEMLRSPDRFPNMIPALQRIGRMLDRNIPIEKALEDFGARSGDDDIAGFAGILIIASRSGGSLADIMSRTSDAIRLHLEINEETDTLLAGKKGELKIMMVIPAFILIYMSLSSPDYMTVLYQTGSGHLIMLAALVLYAAAVFMGRKILTIDL